MLAERRDGVGIHIRGDYVSSKNIKRYGYLFSNGYFNRVLQKDDIVHVSDDLEWCRSNLNHRNLVYHEEKNPYEAMRLLASYDRLIISNSSFSFWAGIFNGREVICPKEWVDQKIKHIDFIPKEWQRV